MKNVLLLRRLFEEYQHNTTFMVPNEVWSLRAYARTFEDKLNNQVRMKAELEAHAKRYRNSQIARRMRKRKINKAPKAPKSRKATVSSAERPRNFRLDRDSMVPFFLRKRSAESASESDESGDDQ